MKEEIKAWLASEEKPYWQGVSLYEKYGGNLSLVASLRRHQTHGNFDALIYELSKLAEVDYVPPVNPAAAPAPVLPEGAPESDLMRELLKRRGDLYVERANLSDTLADLAGDELKTASIQVVEIDEQIIALSSQIRYVEEHGALPPSPSVAEDIEALKSQRKTLGEKVSRQRAKVNSRPDNLDQKAKLDALVAELQKLDDRIRQLSQ